MVRYQRRHRGAKDCMKNKAQINQGLAKKQSLLIANVNPNIVEWDKDSIDNCYSTLSCYV
jgi:hypothetical protein